MATRKDEGDVVAEMDRAMDIIGYVNTWVQPIRARVMMQSTGIQTPVGIKVKGPDIAVIEDLSQQIEKLLHSFKGTKSVLAERISEGYYIDVHNDLERMAGITSRSKKRWTQCDTRLAATTS
jgi:Cu(I)/Ag(I) efflux system membrane protein CusA/SilA